MQEFRYYTTPEVIYRLQRIGDGEKAYAVYSSFLDASENQDWTEEEGYLFSDDDIAVMEAEMLVAYDTDPDSEKEN